MLSNEKMLENKEKFLSIVKSIERVNNQNLLIEQLTKSDFFYAPASATNHCSYPGGLCEHCLNVYDNIIKLSDTFGLNIEKESLAIVALFHDFYKMNFYKSEIRNKKIYSEDGTKHDDQGNYDWISVSGYAKRDVEDRFLIGTPSENAVYITNFFINLTEEEYCAILNCNEDGCKEPAVWKRHPLSLLLYQADCLATFVQENNE